MLNFNITSIPTAELIVELQARGVDMSSAIAQMQRERAVATGGFVSPQITKPRLEERKPACDALHDAFHQKVAVAGSKVVEFPRRPACAGTADRE